MTEEQVQRRLAAILAADVVGYSALMQRAEEATYAEFERLKRESIEPSLSRHKGRLIKSTGDGALAEFASPLRDLAGQTEEEALAAAIVILLPPPFDRQAGALQRATHIRQKYLLS